MTRKLRILLLCLSLFAVVESTTQSGCTGNTTNEKTTETTKETATTDNSAAEKPADTQTADSTKEVTKEAVKEVTQEPVKADAGTEPAPDKTEQIADKAPQDSTTDLKTESIPEKTEHTPEKKPDTRPSYCSQTFSMTFLTRRFFVPNNPAYTDVKVCIHDSIADLKAGKPLTGTTCQVSDISGTAIINSIPYCKEFFVSFTSNGSTSVSKDIMPTFTSFIIIPSNKPSSIRTELITNAEVGQVESALQLKLDLKTRGVLVADVHENRTQPVADTVINLYPTPLPTGATGPIYMPVTFPGMPGTSGTTAAGLGLFVNLPEGAYSAGYVHATKTCSSYHITPATIQPCKAGAKTGMDDCSIAYVVAGWLSLTSGECR